MQNQTGRVTPRLGEFWDNDAEQHGDWKKTVLIFGLGALSWAATYIGMLELIEANMGTLSFAHRLVIGLAVAMLMIMIIWLLDQLFAPLPFTTKLLYVLGYLFLTMISVGFGFGFYWKALESRSESSRSAESAVSQVQSAMHGASTRLQQLTQTLDQLAAMSQRKAEQERTKGGTCPGSGPGEGPRRRMRDADANRFSFAAEMVKRRVSTIKQEIGGLDAALEKIAGADRSTIDQRSGTRNQFMANLSRRLDLTVTGFNAFRTDPQLRQIRTDLATRAEQTTFPAARNRTYTCPDPQLQAALRGVVRAIDQLPALDTPTIVAVEGSEATVEAFRRLGATLYGISTFKLPPSADAQRELQKKAVRSLEASRPTTGATPPVMQVTGLSKRDYIPLAIAVFVDLCLLLVSIGRPVNRLQGLVPKMQAAERGPVIHILSRFSEIHRDKTMRESFEVLRHVVFDYAGAYYVAVPLDAPFTETRTEQVIDPASRKSRLVRKQLPLTPARREELRTEAHLLANLFASFEKDSVFKRVLWLNTDAARKRLDRQGSKFAPAEAFRIYRFNDGAWSEIILGAVMGAARRIEAARGTAAGEQALRSEPSLDALADRMRQAESEAMQAHQLPRAKPVFDRGNLHNLSDYQPDPNLEAQFGPYARRAYMERCGAAALDLPERAAPEPIDPALAQPTRPMAAREPSAAAVGQSQGGNDENGNASVAAGGADETDNVVPFKSTPRSALHDDRDDLKMPSFMTRGRETAGASTAPDDEGPERSLVTAQTGGMRVTAIERNVSFTVPMSDTGLAGGLYALAGAVQSSFPATTAAPDPGDAAAPMVAGHPLVLPDGQQLVAQPAAATLHIAEVAEVAEVEARPLTVDQGATIALPATSDRETSLALPAPIMGREHRG